MKIFKLVKIKYFTIFYDHTEIKLTECGPSSSNVLYVATLSTDFYFWMNTSQLGFIYISTFYSEHIYIQLV